MLAHKLNNFVDWNFESALIVDFFPPFFDDVNLLCD
jgi:hypothetical protein